MGEGVYEICGVENKVHYMELITHAVTDVYGFYLMLFSMAGAGS